MTDGNSRVLRIVLMAFAIAGLLAGMWAGLIRIGWVLPSLRPLLPALHGPLMIGGFLGTLIGLERAVGTGQRWAYAAPLLTALGSVLALAGVPGWPGPLLVTAGSVVFIIVMVTIVRLQPALFTGVIALGALLWFVGNLLWLAGQPISVVVMWWMGFLVFTITGERLELSRLLRLPRLAHGLFVALVLVLLGGMVAASAHMTVAMWITGIGFVGMASWLFQYDIARRRVKAGGQARFISLSLLSGYAWLGAGGVLALWYGGVTAGPAYDAILHAVFLGFVVTMIFAHAPIVFPAVLRVPVTYTPRLYSHLVLLHLSLGMRLLGDLLLVWPLRQWGGMLNVIVLLLFLFNTITSLNPSGRVTQAPRQGATTGR
ncbi:MAG: hypothetical protein H3C34_21160 [Caldilineaceae bacterium]|nr:hypothetical protein [Caldilineaceae bacterium]